VWYSLGHINVFPFVAFVYYVSIVVDAFPYVLFCGCLFMMCSNFVQLFCGINSSILFCFLHRSWLPFVDFNLFSALSAL
jgi:hypothetical protein